MKKKILLKTLVVAAPLLGVMSPLTSCVTNNTKDVTTQLNNVAIDYCPIVVETIQGMEVRADKPLPKPEEGTTQPAVTVGLQCDDSAFVVSGIDRIVAYSIDGEDYELSPTEDYVFQGVKDNAARITFTESYLTSKITQQKTLLITITPSLISKATYGVSVSSPLIEADKTTIAYEEVADGFNISFEIKDAFKDQYMFPGTDVNNYHVYVGEDVESSQYKEIPSIDEHGNTLWFVKSGDLDTLELTFTKQFDPSQFDLNANNFIFDFAIEKRGESQNEAKIALLSQPFVTLSHSVAADAKSFSIKMPLSYHEKKITKAKWTKKTEEHEHKWRDCKITFPDGNKYCLLENEVAESAPINDDIVINIEDVAPVDADHTFENESWTSLGYWVSKVYNTVLDEDGREKKLLQIYGLDENDTFIGRQKTVTWGEIVHTVKVASTFQLNTVKSGHTHDMLLDEDEVDFDHHAAFTFLFTNELTYENEHGATTLLTHNFDGDYDSDSNCWVERSWFTPDEKEYSSSDIRNYMRGGFVKKLSDRENIKSIVKPTASSHFTRSTYNDERYICDTFAIPTGVQMNTFAHPYNSTSNRKWYTEANGDPVFEIFKNINPTESANDFRNFKPTDTNIDPIEYWICSPCYGNELTDWNNDKCINTNGSLTDEDQDIELAVVPCFSI